jgi:hypothetical protein
MMTICKWILLIAALSVLWPFLLIAYICYLMVKNKI